MPEQTNLPAIPDVSVKLTPAVITANIDELKAALTAKVAEQSSTVVTVDNLKDSKALISEMNKTAGAIKAARIQYAREAGVNIAAFEIQMNELEKISSDGVAKLKEQTTKFEDETRAKAQEALQAYLIDQWLEKGVRLEFQTAKVDDLANLSVLTSTGRMAAKSRLAVDERIRADLNRQNKTENRLLKLELESHKAGLSAALNRGHVEHFLFADDETYQAKLAALFETELAREQQAQEVMRKRIEQEKERQAEAEQRADKAEADRKEAERIAAEQKAKHDAEMAALKLQQEQQLVAQREEMQRQPVNPSPSFAPISMNNAAEKHAVGRLVGVLTCLL